MDFGLSDDQRLLQQSARDFLDRECPPRLVREAAEGTGTLRAVERQMADMGWYGLLVPAAFGGLGLGVLDAVVLLIELGRAALPGAFPFSAVLATALIARAASRDQKRRWLPRLSAGEAGATVAWLESGDRLDAAGVTAAARRVRGGYRLTGRKMFVPCADSADVWIAPFRTGRRDREISFFLVDRRAPGISIEPLETIDRTRRLFAVDFDGVEATPAEVLGRADQGAGLLSWLVDLGAVALAADCLGGADRVLEMAASYSKTREQFGRPIGSFQAIKHMAAEIVSEIEPSRSLVWYAACALDSRAKNASRAVSMAKARLSDVYARAANRAVQMHGGIGFTWEHDVHFWFKRAKWNELAFGDPTFHRERIARLGRY